jgi:glycosyltransferase involved in cell wall biosynthesis
MKIAFYTTTILEHGAGLEKYMIETAKNLSEFNDVQADVITMDDDFSFKIINLLSFYYFKKKYKADIYNESLKDIRRKLGKANYYKIGNFENLRSKLNEYDVIYSKNEILEAFIFKYFVGYYKVPPIIFGCHTAIYYPTADSIQSKLHNFLYNGFVYRYLASGIKTFHVINSFEEKRYKEIFPSKEVVKIYNPFNFEEFIENSFKYKFDFNWDKNKFNILWVGRLTEQKGVNDLIYIINEINSTEYNKKIVWNIVGDGGERSKLAKLKENWDNVNYFGHIENKFMASVYEENNLFINTSKWEGFPYTIIEAQSSSLPVVSYDISGCNDIIINNKNGFLSDDLNQFINSILLFLEGRKLEIDVVKFIKFKFNRKDIHNNLINMFKNHAKS